MTGATRLCVGGGVAANCVAIGKIVEAGLFDEVSVPPARETPAPRSALRPRRIARSCYLGPGYPLIEPDTSAWPDLPARWSRT
jgi:carbamoyltransferase